MTTDKSVTDGTPEARHNATAGSMLREARQATGLHIAALAAQLKVPQSKLEALEADRFAELPDITFARALAKAMCRVLKVDAEPVLSLLPSGGEASLARVSQGLNQPFRAHFARDGVHPAEWLTKPFVLAPIGLLLAAVAVAFVPSTWLPGKLEFGTAASEPTVQVAPLPQDAASLPYLMPVTPAPSALGAASQGAPSAVMQTPSLAPVAELPTPVASTLAPGAQGQVPVRLKASAESWVQVTDANGQVLLSKTMRPGDVESLQVNPPLKLRVGNVAGVELSLRGAVVDLAARSKSNVAFLELQ